MTISLSNATVIAGGIDPPLTQVTAGYELRTDGTIWKSVNGTKTKIGSWDTIANQGASFECEFLLASGSALSSNTAPSYTAIGTTQSCALTKGPGTFSSVVTVNLREIANHSNAVSCSVTLEDLLSH